MNLEELIEFDTIKKPEFREKQATEFQEEVMAMAREGITVLEAVAIYCEAHGIEIEDICSYITPKLLDQLTTESIELNRLKKEFRPVQLFE